jgi:hypothetical protein
LIKHHFSVFSILAGIPNISHFLFIDSLSFSGSFGMKKYVSPFSSLNASNKHNHFKNHSVSNGVFISCLAAL